MSPYRATFIGILGLAALGVGLLVSTSPEGNSIASSVVEFAQEGEGAAGGGTRPAVRLSPTAVPRYAKMTYEETPDGEATALSSALSPTPFPTRTAAPNPTAIPREADDSDPFTASIQALAKATGNGRIYGGRGIGDSPDVDRAVPEEIITATPQPTVERVGGQSRGYVMLPLMLPRARSAMERQISILLASEVQDVYLSVLIDGTFSQDFDYLNNVIQRLNADGRHLTLALYLASGPTMRRWDTTLIRTAFSQIHPLGFRYQIEYDDQIRDEVRQLSERARAAFLLNRSIHPANRNIIIPMLEDNLDRQSYSVMRSLVRSVVGDSAELFRNPCPGCFEGNDADPQGDGLEIHDPAAFSVLNSRGGFTLDGSAVVYPGESAPNAVSVENIKQLLDQSLSQNVGYFGLWRAPRQGGGNQLIHPEDRFYEFATPEQETIEIELLRHGLRPVEPRDEE